MAMRPVAGARAHVVVDASAAGGPVPILVHHVVGRVHLVEHPVARALVTAGGLLVVALYLVVPLQLVRRDERADQVEGRRRERGEEPVGAEQLRTRRPGSWS